MSVLSLSRRAGTLALAVILLSSLVVAPAEAENARHKAPIDPAVQQGLLLSAGKTSALVHVVPKATLDQGISAAEDAGLTVGSTYDAIKVFVAYGAPADFDELSYSEAIQYIESNAPLNVETDTSHQATRGQNLLDGEVTLADGTRIDGTGVGVAIVDSGIDGTHPDLASRMGGNVKIVCSVPTGAVGSEATPFEQCRGPKTAVELADTDTTSAGGHGTHVAGIVAGDGTFSDGTYHGAAPGATLYGVSSGTFLTVENALDGLAWVLENHDKVSPEIRVVNNSWGSVYAAYDPDNGVFHKATWKLQEALVQAGVSVVFAAGNAYGTGYRPTTTAECINPTPGIICVANYNDRNTGTRDGGEINGSSSRGQWDLPETWPDVTAPGTAIISTCRSYQPVCAVADESGGANENYATLTGTSMAAPDVAGIVAQIYQANPGLSPADVENLLEDTAYQFEWGGEFGEYGRFIDESNPDHSFSYEKGHGLVDALAAVRVALGLDQPPTSSRTSTHAVVQPVQRATGIALQWDFISITEQEFTNRCTYDDTFVTQSIDAHVFQVPEDLRDTPLHVRIGGTNPIPFYDVSATFYDVDCNVLGVSAQGGDESVDLPANTRYILATPGILAYVTEIFLEYYDITPIPTGLTLAVQGTGSKKALSSTLTDETGSPVAGKTVQFFANGTSIGSVVTSTTGTTTVAIPTQFRNSKTQYGSCFGGEGRYTSSTAGSGATCN